MEIFITLIYFCLCGFFVAHMLLKRRPELFHIGVLCLFSIGYMVVPVLMQAASGLSAYESDQISIAILIHFVYLIFLLLGYFSCSKLRIPKKPLSINVIDEAIEKNITKVFFVSFAFYVLYFFNAQITSYSATDFEAYFHNRGPFHAILAAFATYSQALMAVTFAAGMTSKKLKIKLRILMAISYVSMLVLLLSAGQRLALLSPCIMLFVAFSVIGRGKLAVKVLVTSVLILLLVSPFAVYLREAESSSRGKDKILEIGSSFEYEGGIASSALTSIAERADLIINTITLKEYIDRTEFVGLQYYYSVFVSPLPRIILPNKPYPLSSNGIISGEISSLAWILTKGQSTGSLTAFGGITAYRQGGWISVILDGFFVGALGAIFFYWLGRGGYSAKMFYVIIFTVMVVKRVPSSLFETFAETLPMLPILFSLLFLQRIFFNRKSTQLLKRSH